MSKRITGTRLAIVLAALCALVVSSISGASAMAAGPVLLDIFGNPICADGSLNEGSPHRPGSGHEPDCCAIACASLHMQAGEPPQHVAVALPAFSGSTSIYPLTTLRLTRSQRTPANPRAPPRTA